MQIHFWGARGSLPAPLTPMQVQKKISAVIERITPRDLLNEDTRQKFLISLPEWLGSTIGGNSSCVELKTDTHTIILDAGSGIRELGKKFTGNNNVFHLCLSHFHWDHLMGLPFFGPAYNPSTELHIYSHFPKAKELLEKQMSRPYFPVPMSSFTKNITYHLLKAGQEFKIGNTLINTKKMNHPGNSYSYSFIENGKKFIYATDVELVPGDFDQAKTEHLFFKDADVLILDSQYTVEEAMEKINWGHSAFCYVIDFAIAWNVKKLYLFHHEPNYDDKKIYSMLQSARWYADYAGKSDISISLAMEGLDVIV